MKWQQEIIELHQFFQDWFRGVLPKTAESFARFDQALHNNFQIVSPSGTQTLKPILTQHLYQAYNQQPDITIWIENLALCYQDANILLATYEEHQTTPETTTARLSTVAFIRSEAMPNNVQWLHVHETWLP